MASKGDWVYSYLVWLGNGTACELSSVAREWDWVYSYLGWLGNGTACELSSLAS